MMCEMSVSMNGQFSKEHCGLCAKECVMFKDDQCPKCADICRICAEEYRKMATMSFIKEKNGE